MNGHRSSIKNNEDTPVAVHFLHQDHSRRVTVLERAPTDIVQRRLLEKLWINMLKGSQLFTVLNRHDGLGIPVLWIRTWFCLFLYFLCQFPLFSFSPCACINLISSFLLLPLLLVLPYLALVHWSMPRYRYVTPPPSPCACVNLIPSLLLLPPPYLIYRTWHWGTDVLLSRHRYVTPFFPTLFSVLLRKPVRVKHPVCI